MLARSPYLYIHVCAILLLTLAMQKLKMRMGRKHNTRLELFEPLELIKISSQLVSTRAVSFLIFHGLRKIERNSLFYVKSK